MKPHELAQHFDKLYGGHPRIFRAPGRVNLIGEHTDYNDGFVMPAAVNFSTYVAIAARPDRRLVICSKEFPGTYEFDVDALPEKRTGAWCDYILGVASVLQQTRTQTARRKPAGSWRSSARRRPELIRGSGSRFCACLDESERCATASA